MANIFDGYNKLSDDDIRNQIATLRVVTIGNILGVYGQKAHKGISHIANLVGGLFNKKIMDEPKVEEIDKRIANHVRSLQYISRSSLNQDIRRALGERAGMKNVTIEYDEQARHMLPNNILMDGDQGLRDEALSIKVVDKAADYLGIDPDLTPAEKIEVVSQRYGERMLAELQKQVKKSGDADARKMIAQLDKDINALKPEEREAMRKALKLDEVTGETVRKLLMTTGGSTIFLSAATGFGSYIALTTIMHAVATTALGITLPFAAYTGAASLLGILTGPVGWAVLVGVGIWQFTSGSSKIDGEVLSQSVFLAKAGYRRSFMAEDDELPSWVSPEKDPEAYEKQRQDEEEIARLTEALKQKELDLEQEKSKRTKAEKACQDAQEKQYNAERREKAARDKLADIPRQQQLVQDKLKYLQAELKAVKKQAATTEKEKSLQQEQIRKLNREMAAGKQKLKKLEEDTQAQWDIINEAEKAQNQTAEEIASLKEELSEAKQACAAAEKERDNAEAAASRKISKRADELESHWKIYFSSGKRDISVRRDFSNRWRNLKRGLN